MKVHGLKALLVLATLGSQLLVAQQIFLRPVATNLATDISASGQRAVAVVNFVDLDGNGTELGRYLAEELSVALVQTHSSFKVIERLQLRTILDEHKLAASGLINPSTAKQIGQFTGADCIVTGSITPFVETVRIAVKVITTDTATIVAADTIDLPRTQTISALLGQSTPERNTSLTSGITTKDAGLPPQPQLVPLSPVAPRLVVPSADTSLTMPKQIDNLSPSNNRIDQLARSQDCKPVYHKPIFNPYPITWGNMAGADCTDFAILAGGIHGKGLWMNEFPAHVGEQVTMRIYINNGAADNSNGVMHKVGAHTTIDADSGWIVTRLTASNADSATGSVHIELDPGSRLMLVEGDPSPDVGELPPHFGSAKLFHFTLKVVSSAGSVLKNTEPDTRQPTSLPAPASFVELKPIPLLPPRSPYPPFFIQVGKSKKFRPEWCHPEYKEPILNPYPITWGSKYADCMDFPEIAGSVDDGQVWSKEFAAHLNDVIWLRIYANNGAAIDSGAVMHEVRAKTTVDFESGWIVSQLTALNVAPVTGSVHIKLDTGTHLEIGWGDPNLTIGDLRPFFSESKISYLGLRVLSKNNTSNTSYHESIGGDVASQHADLVLPDFHLPPWTSVKLTSQASQLHVSPPERSECIAIMGSYLLSELSINRPSFEVWTVSSVRLVSGIWTFDEKQVIDGIRVRLEPRQLFQVVNGKGGTYMLAFSGVDENGQRVGCATPIHLKR